MPRADAQAVGAARAVRRRACGRRAAIQAGLFADRARRLRARDRSRAGRGRRPRRSISGYVVPVQRLRPLLRRRHRRHFAALDAGVPGRRYLSGPGLPRPREAIYAARLGLVGGVSARRHRVVFRQSRRPVLPRLARQLLCPRPVHADRVSPRACSCWCGAGRAKAASTAAPSWSAPAAAARR